MKQDEWLPEEMVDDYYNMKLNNVYSFKKGLGKGLASFILFLVPIGIDHFIMNMPEVANLTIGSALVVVWNWVKFHYIRL